MASSDSVFALLPEGLRKRALKLYSASTFDEIRKVREVDENGYRWTFLCAQEFLDVKEHRIAEYFYIETLRREPHLLFGHAGLAACRLNLDRLPAALRSMGKSISMLIRHEMLQMEKRGLEPTIWQTSIPVKGFLIYKDQVVIGDASLNLLESISETDFPNSDDEFSNLILQPALFAFGSYCRNQGRYPEAIASYRLAVRVNPNDSRSQTNLGTCLAEFGETREAINELNKAIMLDPNDAIAFSGLGLAYDMISDHDKSLLYLAKAVELRDGNYPFAQEHISRIRSLLDKHYIFNERVRFEEKKDIEFKGFKEAQKRMQPKELFKKIQDYVIEYLNAFLNTAGGKLYLGIEDDGTVTGLHINRKQRDDINREVSQFIYNTFRPSVAPELYEITFVPVLQTDSDTYVIEVEVQKGSASVYVIQSQSSVTAYIRQSGGKFPMPFDMIRERLKKDEY